MFLIRFINKNKEMKKIFSMLFIMMMVSQAESQNVLSFEEIKDSILQNHPMLKMAAASSRAMNAEAEGAWSWMAPEFGAGFFQTPYNPGKWKGTSDMPGMGMLMVSAGQMFPNRKAQQARYDFMKSKGDVELEKKSGWYNELVSQARSAYYELIVIGQKEKLFQQNEKLLEFMIQSAEIRYKNNLGSMNSYYKLKAALTKLKTAGLVLHAAKTEQQNIINNLLLKEDTQSFEVDTVFNWYPFAPTMPDVSLLQNNSEYRVLEKTILSNRLEQRSEMAGLKPQFGIRFEHMAGFGHQPQMFSLMAMLKLPVASWSSKMNKARAESLEYENQSLQSQQLSYLNRERGKYTALFAALQGVREELKMYETEVIPAMLKNFQVLQISYEQNKAEIFELFDAWQNLLDAKMEVINALQKGMEIQSRLMNIFQITES